MKAMCICLPENPDQIDRAHEHFTSRGLHDVEFFWGINAVVAGLATSHPYERDHPGSGFRMGAKPTGCWLSHWMLWNCMMRMPDEQFLVLETDAKLADDFGSRLARAMTAVPSNFDFLHVGHCCLGNHPKKHVADEVWESKHMQCTHAYIVRRGVLPFLCKTIRKCWAPIDIQLQLECFPHLKTYAVVPRIVSQFDTELSP